MKQRILTFSALVSLCLLLATLSACAKDVQIKPKGQIRSGVSVGR